VFRTLSIVMKSMARKRARYLGVYTGGEKSNNLRKT
jgi:hypothetical protein